MRAALAGLVSLIALAMCAPYAPAAVSVRLQSLAGVVRQLVGHLQPLERS
jgi:hypothetical protein